MPHPSAPPVSHQRSLAAPCPLAPAPILGPLDPAIDLSIIVVNWNTKSLLHACLDSLRRHAPTLDTETIVVDNASCDGSAQMVADAFPEVGLLTNPRNLGFAAANNQALARARGRYLLLLNSDTLLLPNALDAMARYMETHPHTGAVGPRLLNQDGSLQSSARDFPRLDRDALAILEVERWPIVGSLARRRLRRDSLYRSDHRQTRTVDWVMGACLLLRRAALEETGLLDSGYFFFAEEMDLCYRLRRHGWSTDFLAGAEIVHLGGQSHARLPAARLVWHYSGLLRFYRLHQSRSRQLLLRLVIALNALAHIAWLLARHRRTSGARPLLSAYARVLAHALW